MSGFGDGIYGFGPYGGVGGELQLVSSDPTHGQSDVDPAADLTLVFSEDGGAFDPTSLDIAINGFGVYSAGVWAAGYSGTWTPNGDNTVWTLVLDTHPVFDTQQVTVFLNYVDGQSWTIVFGVALDAAVFTRAKTYCLGKRVDLYFTVGDAVGLRVVRSKTAYSFFLDDPGEVIFESNTIPDVIEDDGLEENTFYYYTLFSRFSVSGPWEPAGEETRVQGLSIRDFAATEGDYVYEMMPANMRARDADETKPLAERYTLRTLARILQCGVNIYRGYAEALGSFRDPDSVPAGFTGVPYLQAGILSAFVQDLGLRPERSFDAGVLRRLALGLIPAFQQKGTCNGLTTFASVFTNWNISACVEEGDSACGRFRFVSAWDALDGYCGWSQFGEWFPQVGYTRVAKTGLRLPKTGSLGDVIAPSLSGVPTVLADSFGGAVCVLEILDDGDFWRFNHTDPTSRLRDRAFVTISGGTTVLEDLDGPWNDPSVKMNFPPDTFKGAELKYGGGLAFTTTITTHGNGDGTGKHSVTFAPSSLVDQTFASLRPIEPLQMYQGEGTILPSNTWHVPLLYDYSKFSLWSVLSGGGSPMGTYAPTASTARLIVSGVATKQEVASVTDTAVTFSGAPFVPGDLVGKYLVANFRYPQVYRIVANTTDTVYLVVGEGDVEPTLISEPGSFGVVLSARDALKYQQLSRLIKQFVPLDYEAIVDFA